MNINSENKQRIHDVLISDLQRRIFKQYNERTSECDDMFVYYNKETECEIECSLELDYEFQQQSE